MRFLIDECLSPELATLAHRRGHEAQHVVRLGHGGAKDWELKPLILEGDWTFVTNNAIDFRGPAAKPGASGQYADVSLHAGLVCLSAPAGMDLDLQLDLFDEALNELQSANDLVNQVLEVSLVGNEFTVRRYRLPAQS